MKAVVFRDLNDIKHFVLTGSEQEMYKALKKISGGKTICLSESQFEKFKEEYLMFETEPSDLMFKNFLGPGLYDYEGNFFDKIVQSEGEYWVEDFVECTYEINVSKIDLIKPMLN